MNYKNKILTLCLSVFLLIGCVGKQASFSEVMRDNFAFTAAENVPSSEQKCIKLTKSHQLESGSVTYFIPAGRYIGKKMNSTGYFYYAPELITTSNWFLANKQQGLYINHEFSAGNLFGINPQGYDDRPIRGAVLTQTIFSDIKKSDC